MENVQLLGLTLQLEMDGGVWRPCQSNCTYTWLQVGRSGVYFPLIAPTFAVCRVWRGVWLAVASLPALLAVVAFFRCGLPNELLALVHRGHVPAIASPVRPAGLWRNLSGCDLGRCNRTACATEATGGAMEFWLNGEIGNTMATRVAAADLPSLARVLPRWDGCAPQAGLRLLRRRSQRQGGAGLRHDQKADRRRSSRPSRAGRVSTKRLRQRLCRGGVPGGSRLLVPGMVIQANAPIKKEQQADRATSSPWADANLCRCGL